MEAVAVDSTGLLKAWTGEYLPALTRGPEVHGKGHDMTMIGKISV